MLMLLIAALAGFGATAVLVPICQRVAERLGYVAKPKEDRWHRRAVPLLGGVAIALPVLIGSLVVAPRQALLPLIVCGALMFGLGLVDDIAALRPSTKLVAQIAISSALLVFGARLRWVDSLTVDTMLTLVWLVGITNAFNLLDNMDGLAAGTALIATFALLANDALGPEAVYLTFLTGSLTGFLVYNVHPASVFMGDSGSLFIGLSIAASTLHPQSAMPGGSHILSVIAAPVLVLLIPIFDTTLVTVSRLVSGRRASQGGRDHSSHRLVAIGLPERTAVSVLWAIAVLGASIGAALRRTGGEWSLLPGVLLVLAMLIFAAYLGRVRVYGVAQQPVGAGRVTTFVSGLMYKRRLAEILLDICLVSVAYYAAWRLRFEDESYGVYFPSFLQSLPIVVGIQTVALAVFGAYRGVWRYFGLMDAVTVGKGVTAGLAAIVGTLVYLYRFENYSRGVFVIYAALALLLIVISRGSFRLIGEFAARRREGRRFVVYGAGDGGALALREMLNNAAVPHRMLGFIDDDPDKRRSRVLGYPVLGGFDALQTLVSAGGVDAIVVSTRFIRGERLRGLRDVCVRHGVTLTRLQLEFENLVAEPN